MSSTIVAFLLLAAAAIVAPATAARSHGVIALYYAGKSAIRVRTLKENDCLPKAYYTFRCELPRYPNPGAVKIFINGKFYMTQKYAPYFTSKYNRQYVFKVKLPNTKRVHIKCQPTRGKRVGVTVYTVCPAHKRPIVPSHKPHKRRTHKRKPAYKPKPKPARRHKRKHVRKPKRKHVRKHVRKPKRKAPYKPHYRGIHRRNCVIIPYWRVKHVNRGWVMNKGGITYKPKDNFGGTFPGWTSVLRYSFKVPVRGRYAVTLDVTTKHWTEHNDGWLRFEAGGFQLRRFHKIRYVRGNQFAKAYHNRNGRSTEAYSVDFDPHSFSTARVLRPHTPYEMIVGARSTKYTLHNIIMFPCNGKQCEYNSAYWKKYVRTCKA